MEEDAGSADQLGNISLNPSFGLDPSYLPRSVALEPKQVFPETTSALLAPLSTTYAPPGTRLASLAPQPGQPANLIQGANLNPPVPQVAPVIPQGSVAPQVQVAQAAPALRAPAATPGGAPRSQLPLASSPAADVNANPLQTRKDLLQSQADRAHQQGHGWFNQLMNNEGAAKSREEETRLRGEISQIDQQIQQQATAQNLASNYHLNHPVPASTDAAAIPQLAMKEWREEGNVGAYMALSATGHADVANLPVNQTAGMRVLSKDVAGATELYDKLDKAKDGPEYKRMRAQVIREAQGNGNYREFNLTEGSIPKSKEEYDKSGVRSQLKDLLGKTSLFVKDYERQLANIGTPQPITNKEAADAINYDKRFSNGDQKSGLQAVKLENGQVGSLITNSHQDISEFKEGGKWTSWNATTKTAAGKMISENPELNGVLSQHKLAVRFDAIVSDDENYKDAAGRTLVADATGGTFRNMAEKAQGSGNVSLVRIFEHTMGTFESTLNAAYTNWGAYKNWLLSGRKGDEPKLEKADEWSPQTIEGLKRIGKFNLAETSGQLSRLSGVAEYVGQNAGKLSDIGISEDAKPYLQPYRDRANHQARLDWDNVDAIIRGGRRIEISPGTLVDPNTPGFTPAGTYQRHIDAINKQVIGRPPFPTGGVAAPGTAGGPAAPPAAPGTFPTGGAAPVPFTPAGPPPAAPAGGGGALRPLAATPAASLVQSLAGPPAAAPALVQTAQLPPSWGVGTGTGGGGIVVPPRAPSGPPAVRPPGATLPSVAPATVPGPTTALTIPAHLRGNPVASTVYTTAHQTATNLAGGNAVVGNNVAAIAASSAKSESSYKPHELHDPDKTTGEYAGYGLFGHQGSRLSDMQKFSGNAAVGKPDAAISPQTQSAFYAREIMDAAKKDPFIARVVNDPNASAEDLTRVQMRMERPQGYKGPGTEEQGMHWNERLAATQTMLLGQKGRLTSTPQEAERAYYGAGSRMMGATVQNAPAIGAVGGNILGTPFGPVGQAVGAEVGGITGGAIKYGITTPREQQTPGGYATAAIEGGAEALPMTIPGAGWRPMVGRALTSGGVEAGKELYESGGDIPKSLNAAGVSTLSAAAAETFMLALGKGFSQVYKMATNNNKVAMENAGRTLAEQKPKNMLADGTTVENKAYTDAENFAKDRNIDPDHLAHAYEQVKKQANRGEAFVSRPSRVEQRQAAAGLDEVVQGAGAATAGTPLTKAQQIISDVKHPAVLIKSGLVPPAFSSDANTAAREMSGAGKPRSTNFGQVIDNMATARTTLLEKERAAKALTPNSSDFVRKDEMVKNYNLLGQHVRQEQEKVIRALLPPDKAQPLIDQLHASSARYRTAMMAGGDDIVQTIAAGGAKANQARTAFNNLAGADQEAKNMMRALTTAEGRKGKSVALSVAITASGLMSVVPIIGPVVGGVGTVMSAVKLGQIAKDYMVQRGAGKMVTMKDLVFQDIAKTRDIMRRGGATVGGSIGGNFAHSLVYPEPTQAQQ